MENVTAVSGNPTAVAQNGTEYKTMSKRMVNINGYYRHFKGNLYQVDGIAKREDNRQWQVIYHRCDLDDTQTPIHWIRPMDEFLSPIDHTKYPTYTQKYRFVEENYDFFSD